MKKIAVIGGGGAGHAVAADLTLRGFEVHLCDSEAYRPVLEETAALGYVELHGRAGRGRVKVHTVTTDIAGAVTGTDLVIGCANSNRSGEVARMIGPYLRPGQHILLSAGNGGSVIFRRVLDELGLESVLVGETSGSLYPCRLTGPGQVLIGMPYGAKKTAAFPASDTAALIEAFRGVYELLPARDILETVFNAPNLIGHCAVTLLNVGAIENSKETYYAFRQGVSPSVVRLTEAMWEEKKQVMDALGLFCGPGPAGMFSRIMDPDCRELDDFRALAGPDSIESRYISEDMPNMMCLFISVAHAMGVPVPLFEALVRVVSAVSGTDYYAKGRTLENLGLDHLKGEELIAYFSGR